MRFLWNAVCSFSRITWESGVKSLCCHYPLKKKNKRVHASFWHKCNTYTHTSLVQGVRAGLVVCWKAHPVCIDGVSLKSAGYKLCSPNPTSISVCTHSRSCCWSNQMLTCTGPGSLSRLALTQLLWLTLRTCGQLGHGRRSTLRCGDETMEKRGKRRKRTWD